MSFKRSALIFSAVLAPIFVALVVASVALGGQPDISIPLACAAGAVLIGGAIWLVLARRRSQR